MECGWWPGSTSALVALIRSRKQDRWGIGCDGVAACQTHVMGGAGGPRSSGLQALLYGHSRMGGSCIHLPPPPKKKYVYIYVWRYII